jgi:hypothetical protein
MHADTYIPRRLDDQWKIGFWDVDVAAPLLFGLFMGYMSGSKFSFALCLAAGASPRAPSPASRPTSTRPSRCTGCTGTCPPAR